LKAKNYTYFGTEGVLYTNLWSQFNKAQQGSPKYKRIALSLCLRLAPSPWLHVRPNAPPTLGSRPLALRLSPDRRPAVRLPPPDLPISATATPPVADRSRLAALVPTPQHQHEGGRHWLLLWICYGRYNLIVHYIMYLLRFFYIWHTQPQIPGSATGWRNQGC